MFGTSAKRPAASLAAATAGSGSCGKNCACRRNRLHRAAGDAGASWRLRRASACISSIAT